MNRALRAGNACVLNQLYGFPFAILQAVGAFQEWRHEVEHTVLAEPHASLDLGLSVVVVHVRVEQPAAVRGPAPSTRNI
jgi:hypothetical protein